MTNQNKQKQVLKYFVFPLLLISLFTFKANKTVPVSAATIITTRSSETYINDYYSSISSSLSGSALASALESRLKAERKNSFSYNSMQSTAFPYTDVDPTRPNDGYIVSFYSGKTAKGYTGMNKEHTWPDSHGGGKIDNDPHMVRPTLTSENSTRGNKYFAESGSNGWDPASFGDLEARGMSARIILYGAVIGKSSGLTLEDVGRGQGSGNGGQMGKLGDLLKWNLEYPVNQKEIIRNETLDISLNYNRNPFIDRPEYACAIWGDTNDNTRNICSSYNPVEVEGVSVSPTSSTLNLLSEIKGVQLSATVSPTNASNKNVTWSSSDNSVATVSSSGFVTGLKVGHATIFATSSGNTSKKGQASIEVVSATIPVTGVNLNKTATTIETGRTETLVATVLPSGATNKSVTWTSSNPTIATVNSGVVSGLRKGNVTITARTNDGNYTASALISVVTPAPLTTITGSFYNTAGNSEGSAVTPTNLNNGTTGNFSTAGFGGKNVVNNVETTQSYLPRGGGFALGSNSNPGYLKITLTNEYKANKVEVLINGSVSGASASLATNTTPKSNVSGTNGTQNSNPGSGTYYTLEFNEPHNYFEINTTKRMIVVEIRLTIGSSEVIEETPREEAEGWSSHFLALTNEGCNLSDRNMLLSAWNEAAETFNDLSNDAQQIIVDSNAEYSEENVVEHARSRYEVIRVSYGFNDFLAGEANYSENSNKEPITNNMASFLTFFVFAIAGFSFLPLLKKKQTK